MTMNIEDTVNDFPSFDVAGLEKIETNELSKPTRVIVVDCLGIAKGLEDGTRERRIKMTERERWWGWGWEKQIIK